MAQSAERTNPGLWDAVKAEITAGAKGGKPGQWSARKAQLAVAEYKRRGGGYEESGFARDETDLHQWTQEDWGTRSGAQSGESGERYLPREIRALLTEDEYARSTAKKRKDGAKGRQHSAQPKDVREKVARIKRESPTKAMLMARAKELGIAGRSGMDRDALLRAIEGAVGDG
ncbi:hypothetical protein [Sphingobium phenoxybenzoativorans]|uniref:hypothetical protein n=1 Tax=Sphingobium phenoxybenzoativorans TaxID=1592790 RepID=UPI0008724DA9|nr:hypothetical protein [Sphingobium phenoxybenzoativorans]